MCRQAVDKLPTLDAGVAALHILRPWRRAFLFQLT
jgi:hypothetical protein